MDYKPKKQVKLNFIFSLLLFSNLSLFAQYDCGTIHTPEIVNALRDKLPELNKIETNFLNNKQRFKAAIVPVPVKIHIIKKSDGTGGLTETELNDAFDVLNGFYSNANIEFTICSDINYINNSNYYNFDFNQEGELTNAYSVSGVINIYFVNNASYNNNSICGYAYLPSNRNDTVIMANSCATNGSTLPHELGHYFNLLHTHGGSEKELVDGSNCSTEGDLICDTPADPKLSISVNSSCAYTGTARDANGASYTPPTRNVMSYSRKECRTEFTAQQYARIYASLQTDKNYLMCPSLDVNKTTKNELNVYLTANKSEVIIEYTTTNKTPSKYTLVNVYGQLVASGILKNNFASIPLFKNGIYFLSLQNDQTKAFKKFAK